MLYKYFHKNFPARKILIAGLAAAFFATAPGLAAAAETGTSKSADFTVGKPANKKQVLFSKVFLLKMNITNKPAFFIWFVEMHIFISLLIYFHYSCIINSQKLVESCYLCNLTCFTFSLFLFNEIIYRISTFFLHDQTSHCFESYFSKG